MAGAAQVMRGNEHVFAPFGFPFDEGKAKTFGREVKGGLHRLWGRCQKKTFAFFCDAASVCQLEERLVQQRFLGVTEVQSLHDLRNGEGPGLFGHQRQERRLQGGLRCSAASSRLVPGFPWLPYGFSSAGIFFNHLFVVTL